MKEATFLGRLYRRCFFFEDSADDIMTRFIGTAAVTIVISEKSLKVIMFENGTEVEGATFFGPNRQEFALDYIDGLQELLS